MKKKILVGVIAAAALLITALLIVLTVNRIDRYLTAEKYDYIENTAYNGVRIVGKDGEFHLERDGEYISGAYASIRSVNDFYDTRIGNLIGESKKPVKLYDYYLARRSEEPEFYLIGAMGEEYRIVGGNYSIDSALMPVLIFRDNGTGKMALLSLERLDSGLSALANGEIILQNFNSDLSLEYEDIGPSEICTYIKASYDNDGQTKTSIFDASGSLIMSGYEVRAFTVCDDTETERTFFYCVDSGTLVSLDGKINISGIQSPSDVDFQPDWGICRFNNEKDGKTAYILLGVEDSVLLSSDVYDFSDMVATESAIAVKNTEKGLYAVVSVFDSTRKYYDEVICIGNYMVARETADASVRDYLDSRGKLLVSHDGAALTLNTTLSGDGYYVFDNPDAETGKKEYIVCAASKDAHSIIIDSTSVLTRLTVKGNYGIYDGALFMETSSDEDGRKSYRIHSPLESNAEGLRYDSIDVYETDGILFALAASYDRELYDFIDLPSNTVVSSFGCAKEDFALMSFEHIDSISLISDRTERNSSVPVMIVTLKKYTNSAGDTESVRYLAIFRNAPYGDKAFEYAQLSVYELGKNLCTDDPITFFENSSCFSINKDASSAIYALNHDGKLVQLFDIPYRVAGMISDVSDPDTHYLKVCSDSEYYGLYDMDGNEILAPYYTAIRFVDSSYIGVRTGTGYGVLSLKKGKISTVIDMKYSSVSPLGEGGFLLVDGNEHTYVFRGKKMICDDPVNGVSYITDYSGDENGYSYTKTVVLNIGGVKYTHKYNSSESVYRTEFNSGNHTTIYTLNKRAKVVYYRKDGALVGTDVIFPDAYSSEQFRTSSDTVFDSATDGVWCYPSATNTYYTPVTKQDVIDNNDNIINLTFIATAP
ncbi:MAG: hypothetical protein ACI3XQ_07245 [Eubacteriales bacterium]